MLTDRAMCRAGAWLAILLAAASSSLARSAFDVEAPSDPAGAIRATRAVGGRTVHRTEYGRWLMPLIVTSESKKTFSRDGRLSGFGVRIPGSNLFFIAHIKSITHILDNMANGTVEELKDSSPFMWYGPKLSLNIWSNLTANLFKPAHRLTLSDEIAVYKLEKRRAIDPDKEPPENSHVLLGASMEFFKKPTDCRLIVYSASPWRYDTSKAWGAQRQLVALPVTVSPKNLLDDVSIRADEPKSSGAICGVMSDLGAPIVCGQGSEMRVTHVVANKHGEGCTSSFQALSLWPFRKLLLDVKDY